MLPEGQAEAILMKEYAVGTSGVRIVPKLPIRFPEEP
jgi:hypothetical protein